MTKFYKHFYIFQTPLVDEGSRFIRSWIGVSNAAGFKAILYNNCTTSKEYTALVMKKYL